MISLDDKNRYPYILDDIWYSDEKRMKSIWKVFSMEDTGKLKVYKKKIKFLGKKNDIEISKIHHVFMAKQSLNYGTHLASFLICLGCIWFTFLILVYSIDYFLLFSIIIIFLYPVSLFGVKSNWIGIEFFENNEVSKVFFSDGSFLGWEKTINKSGSLYENIKYLVEEESIIE